MISLSVSQLLLYLRCPKKYWYIYKDKLPQRMSKEASLGVSIHGVLHHYVEQYLPKIYQESIFEEELKTPMNIKDFLALIDKQWVSQGYKSKEEEFAKKKIVIEHLFTIFQKWEPLFHTKKWKPLLVEKAFKFQLTDQIQLTGRWDRIDELEDGTLHIIDYKTGQLTSEESLKKNIQLGVYLLAAEEKFQKHVSKLTLHYIMEDKELTISEQNLKKEDIKEIILHTAQQIQAEQYAPTPTKEKCHHCEFRNICPSSTTKITS